MRALFIAVVAICALLRIAAAAPNKLFIDKTSFADLIIDGPTQITTSSPDPEPICDLSELDIFSLCR